MNQAVVFHGITRCLSKQQIGTLVRAEIN